MRSHRRGRFIFFDGGHNGKSRRLPEAQICWQRHDELIESGLGMRRHLGMAARSRVQQQFSLSGTVDQYQALYAQVVGAEGLASREVEVRSPAHAQKV